MLSIIPGFEYDIFISYRHKDNEYDGWVSEFIENLRKELRATFKEDISVYFDTNPHDGLLETHNVAKSLEGKLKCLIFIPIISQTYCDLKSFAWQHELCAFNKLAKEDQFGRDIKLSNGNVASRIVPVKIHDLDTEDKTLLENELGGVLRSVEFIYKEAGVNRPLKPTDNKNDNQNRTDYRNQVNKVSNVIKEVISSLKNPSSTRAAKPGNLQPATGYRPSFNRNKIRFASLILVVLATTYYFFYPNLFSSGKEVEILDKSIAVLPFVDMSAGKDHEYLSEGLSDELLNLLSKIPELKVIGRTSSFSFKDKSNDLRTIGKKLGVATILEGSVRKEGNKIRVHAQLIKAADGSQLWSERYDRDLEGIFKLQDEIAGAVVKQLQLKLLAVKKRTVHPEAYEAYLKGRFLAYKTSVKSLETAMQYFKSALQKDPDYPLAHVGIGSVWWLQGNMKLLSFHEAHLQAKSAALKAIKLDEQLAEGHDLLARILFWYEWDWQGAEKEYLRAIELNPNYPDARGLYSALLMSQGRVREAKPQIGKAIELDSLNSFFQEVYAYQLGQARLYDDAIAYARKTQGMAEQWDVTFLHQVLWRAFHQKRMYPEALAEIKTIFAGDAEIVEALSRGYAKGGYAEANREAAEKLATRATLSFWEQENVAILFAFAGQKTKALDWLEKGYESRHSMMSFIGIDPHWDDLRSETRFHALLHKLNLKLDFAKKL